MSHIQLTEPETGAGIDTQTAPNPDSSLRREQDGQRIEIDRPGHPRRYGRIAQRIPDRRIGIQCIMVLAASFKAIEAAILNAISDESTSW